MSTEVLNDPNVAHIELLRRRAVSNLDSYLKNEEETVLRTDQVDVMQSLHDFLDSGKTAGYISLPPGAGKTVLASEMASAMKVKKAVVLSPTQTILRQTGQKFDEFSPEVNITDFYAHKKDLSGQVINTTYHSFIRMLDEGLISADEIELMFCDELHMALGEERHKIWRRIPNAIKVGLTATAYFTPLDGYEKRGIVDPKEEWTGLFREKIHSMSMEEAIEKGILAPLDVHLIRTKVRVEDVNVLSTGDYNKGQLERALNTYARNYMTLAMVAGLDKLPAAVHLDHDQKKEIAEINEKIKGKRTAIFGLSIEHVEELTEMLRAKGISAQAYHSKTNLKNRDQILKDHKEGKTQVILGVDALRVGWDSPETEVGMYLAPTQSGIVAVQELGRILRPSPETGKEKAIAIQFADQFVERDKAPILIPDIFDPYCVLRGTQLGKEIKHSKIKNEKEKASITFSGLDVSAIIAESKINELLRSRFQTADLGEVSAAIEEVIVEIKNREENISSFEFYKQIAKAIPRISANRQLEALQAVAGLDSNVAKEGAKVVVFTAMGTIISGAERYFGADEEENSEILSSAVLAVYERINDLKIGEKSISQVLYFAAQRGAAQYIANREGMTLAWALEESHSKIEKAIENVSVAGERVAAIDLRKICQDLADETGVDRSLLKDYIMGRYGYYENDKVITEADAIVIPVFQNEVKENIESALLGLKPRERKVLELRFGIGEESEEHTLDKAGIKIGVNRERVRQIEASALYNLRHPSDHLRTLARLFNAPLAPPTYPACEQTESVHKQTHIGEIKRLKKEAVNEEIVENKVEDVSLEKSLWQEWLRANYLYVSPKQYEHIYSKYAEYRDQVLMDGGKLWPDNWKQRQPGDPIGLPLQKKHKSTPTSEQIVKETPALKTEEIQYGDRKIEVTSDMPIEDYLQSLQETGKQIMLQTYSGRKKDVRQPIYGIALSNPDLFYTDGKLNIVKDKYGKMMKFDNNRYIAWYGESNKTVWDPEDYIPTNYYLQTNMTASELRGIIKRLKLTNVQLQLMSTFR